MTDREYLVNLQVTIRVMAPNATLAKSRAEEEAHGANDAIYQETIEWCCNHARELPPYEPTFLSVRAVGTPKRASAGPRPEHDR